MQIVFGYMFIFNITDIQSVYTERSTGCQIITPFSIFFFSFHRQRNTYIFIVTIAVFIVCNFIICLLFFVVYTEEIGNLVHGFTLTRA
jgi:ABC-type branched-subunit amino acid transport system permease subunit